MRQVSRRVGSERTSARQLRIPPSSAKEKIASRGGADSLKPVAEAKGTDTKMSRDRSNTEEVTVVNDETDLFADTSKEPSVLCAFEEEDPVPIGVSKAKNEEMLFEAVSAIALWRRGGARRRADPGAARDWVVEPNSYCVHLTLPSCTLR